MKKIQRINNWFSEHINISKQKLNRKDVTPVRCFPLTLKNMMNVSTTSIVGNISHLLVDLRTSRKYDQRVSYLILLPTCGFVNRLLSIL